MRGICQSVFSGFSPTQSQIVPPSQLSRPITPPVSFTSANKNHHCSGKPLHLIPFQLYCLFLHSHRSLSTCFISASREKAKYRLYIRERVSSLVFNRSNCYASYLSFSKTKAAAPNFFNIVSYSCSSNYDCTLIVEQKSLLRNFS